MCYSIKRLNREATGPVYSHICPFFDAYTSCINIIIKNYCYPQLESTKKQNNSIIIFDHVVPMGLLSFFHRWDSLIVKITFNMSFKGS